MILDVRGSQAAKKVIQLATPLETQNTVQLKYFRFPAMPSGLCRRDYLRWPRVRRRPPNLAGRPCALPTATSAGRRKRVVFRLLRRICEPIRDRQSVSIAFSIEFAGYLMFDTIFPANAAWEIGLSEKVIDQYTHYAVTVKNVKGSYDGRDYDEVIGRVYRDGVIETVPHNLRNTTRRLDVEVRAVRLSGESEPYSTTIEWGLGLEIL